MDRKEATDNVLIALASLAAFLQRNTITEVRDQTTGETVGVALSLSDVAKILAALTLAEMMLQREAGMIPADPPKPDPMAN